SNGVSLGNQIITIKDTLNLTQGSLNLQNESLNIDGHIIRTTGSINTNVGSNLSLGNNTSEMELPSNLFAASPAEFRNLQIDRAGGLKLGNQAIQIDNKLILSNGIINTNSNDFIFTKNASVGTALDNNIAGSSASYIDGCSRKIGNTAFTFPIGNAGEFAPAGISAADGGGNDTHFFDVCYFNENPNTSFDINELQEGLNHVSSVEYWTISRTGTNNVHVTLSWDERSGTIRNSNDIIIAHWNSVDGKWENKNQTQKTGDNNSGNATSELISDFSPFTLGSTSNQNILPVELSYFKANCQPESIKLTWQTLTETNNEYFILERFENNKWHEISKISGAGNSNIPVGYSYLDFNNGENIYRLNQKDFDGKIRSIALQSIECNTSMEFYLNIFPNPSHDIVKIQSNSELNNKKFTIKNNLNQTVIENYLDETSTIDLSQLKPGIYFIVFEDIDKRLKFVKQ
ncbi:MAG: T9SS type A sorting domain-containing protein, partial [Sphingobacteriia bacterium]|nr:T9SS type A sorting domain-containing protein [Sphingobacteriia bacterium]